MAWEALTIETGWGGEQTVTLRRGRVISCTLICSCSYSACWNEEISIDFAFFCSADWWASEEGAAFYKGMWHRRGLSHCLCGAAETQQELWLLVCAMHRRTIVSLMSYCIPESGVHSEKSNIHLLCQGIRTYHSYIYLFWKKNVCIRYYLLTSNTSSSDIGISVGIIRLKNNTSKCQILSKGPDSYWNQLILNDGVFSVSNYRINTAFTLVSSSVSC